MSNPTTADDINDRIQNKQKGFIEGIIGKSVRDYVPRCPICDNPYVNGAVTYQHPDGRVFNVCIPCTVRAIAFFVDKAQIPLR